MRKWLEIDILNIKEFVQQIVNYSINWQFFMLLNNNSSKTSQNKYNNFDFLVACGAVDFIRQSPGNNFANLKKLKQKHNDWIFGHFNYDLKNEVEKLYSINNDSIGFPEAFFFVPEYIFKLKDNVLKIGYIPMHSTETDVYKLIQNINKYKSEIKSVLYNSDIKHNFTKTEYISNVEKLQQHILKGDIYEVNFCTEYLGQNFSITPTTVYNNLNKYSPSPFSAYYKLENKYLISSSPERFLAKRGSKIISQPIKGTIKRGEEQSSDLELKKKLETDVKERAENIMIVDLVRNDLSKTALQGSVKVEELCKIYSFEFVHQMISTVISEIDTNNVDSVDVIKNCFPMGSMTGAPKVRAMKLIEKYERSKRGLYSGSVGYFTPEDDFDFNVIIRSILFNAEKKNISISVGSAITHKSVPENEYEECLLKAQAMLEVLKK